jgi:hypothetical protein
VTENSNSADIGRELRSMIFQSATRDRFQPTAEFPRVYGVVLDYPLDENFVTIVALSSGEASLYTTSTFGIIGGGHHESVRAAAKQWVHAADYYASVARPVADHPYPPLNKVFYYFLTYGGVRLIEDDYASLEQWKGDMIDFFALAQEVVTELRNASEQE